MRATIKVMLLCLVAMLTTGVAWQQYILPDCQEGTGCLNYNASTNQLTCGPLGGGGAPTTASYVTSTSEAGLSNEQNIGALTTGLLLNTVSGGIATLSQKASPTGAVVGTTDTQKLVNKRIQPRVSAHSDTTPVAVNSDNFDVVTLAELSQATTISAPTGTPDSQQLLAYVFKTTVARAVTWNAVFVGTTQLPIPATTSGGGVTDYFLFSRNHVTATQWDFLGSSTYPTASDTASGMVELATSAETSAGTDMARAVTPDGLSQSIFGTRHVELECVADATALTIGDGKCYFRWPDDYAGWLVVSVSAHVGAAVSSSGAVTVDIDMCGAVATGVRCSGTNRDLLSTNLTIDANEDGSETAATVAVINTANDDIAAGEWFRGNVDGAGTGTQGLYLIIGIRKP